MNFHYTDDEQIPSILTPLPKEPAIGDKNLLIQGTTSKISSHRAENVFESHNIASGLYFFIKIYT